MWQGVELYDGPSMGRFDPRAWNLGVSLSLLVGCGPEPSAETESSSSATSESSTGTPWESDETPDPTEESGPECEVDEDCAVGLICVSGKCCYDYSADECEVDDDCEPNHLCLDEECRWVRELEACGSEALPPLALQIPEGTLAMRFVDTDDDGDEEVVLVTEDALVVFAADSGEGVASPRGLGSGAVDALAVGHFDDAPGEDLMLLVDDQLVFYGANGPSSFASASLEPSPVVGSLGLLAGDFDGQLPDDTLVWGAGSVLLRGNSTVNLGYDPVVAVGVFPFDTEKPGFALHTDEMMTFVSLDGVEAKVAKVAAYGELQQLAAIRQGDWTDLVVGFSTRHGKTLFETWDADGRYRGLESHAGTVEAVAVGDFDADGFESIMLLGSAGVTLLAAQPDCLPMVAESADLIAAGDFDGDPWDELAIARGTTLWVFTPLF